jgi:hypothetical protein
MAQAASLTCAHLQTYFESFFNLTVDSELDTFKCNDIGSQADPLQIDYDVTATFKQASYMTPTQEEVDILVQTALLPPEVDKLRDSLRALPASNPFSTTSEIAYVGEGAIVNSMEKPTDAPPSNQSRKLYAALILTAFVFLLSVKSFLVYWVLSKSRRMKKETNTKLEKSPYLDDEEALLHKKEQKTDPADEDLRYSPFLDDSEDEKEKDPPLICRTVSTAETVRTRNTAEQAAFRLAIDP